MLSHYSSNGGFSAEEKRTPSKQPPAIAGIFVASGLIYHDVMQIWKETYETVPKGYYQDQWALNAMIFRKKVPYKGFGYDIVSPANKPEDIAKPACLLHYWANRKEHMPIAWQAWKNQNTHVDLSSTFVDDQDR